MQETGQVVGPERQELPLTDADEEIEVLLLEGIDRGRPGRRRQSRDRLSKVALVPFPGAHLFECLFVWWTGQKMPEQRVPVGPQPIFFSDHSLVRAGNQILATPWVRNG